MHDYAKFPGILEERKMHEGGFGISFMISIDETMTE